MTAQARGPGLVVSRGRDRVVPLSWGVGSGLGGDLGSWV